MKNRSRNDEAGEKGSDERWGSNDMDEGESGVT